MTDSAQLNRLAACSRCGLQYRAGARQPGGRFRCACGALVEIGREEPHDAAVVRCSSCGHPRHEGRAACDACGADFTLHERDLHTVCPGCMSRISDRARFCHACGLAIAPQGPVGVLSDKHCPICGDAHRLSVRNLDEGAVAVLECNRCAGIWLGHRIFGLLERRARQDVDTWSEPSPPAPTPSTTEESASFYRPCVECGKLMHRRNYGEKSGVIVDLCRAHGLWFDAGELDAILAWVRGGGVAGRRARARNRAETLTVPAPPAPDPQPGWADFVTHLIAALVEFLSRHLPRR